MWDIFNLRNLVTKYTCYKSLKGSIKDLILTNRPRNIQKTSLCETGLSDCHKPIFTILKSTFKELPPPKKKKKQITCRSCKDFNEIKLCYDLDQELLKGKMYNHGINSYSKFTEIFSNTLEKHTPLKFKTIRNLTVCSCHVTYAFQSESIIYSCLNVKELLARSRREI